MWTIFWMFIISVMIAGVLERQKARKQEKRREAKLREIAFPNPETSSDYLFYQAIVNTSVLHLKGIYEQIKAKGYLLKPRFETAIQEKLRCGVFANPINFKEEYGVHFDFIGFHIEANYSSGVLVDKIDYCIVQNGRVVENAVLTGMWGRDVDEYFRNNILVIWGDEEKVLRDMLNYHKRTESCRRIVKISEIALAKGWPVNLEKLETQFKIKNGDQTKSFRYAALLSEFVDLGIDVQI